MTDKNFLEFRAAIGEGTIIKHEHAYPDSVMWSDILEDFVTFLEAMGYMGVRERIRIAYNGIDESKWNGGWFDMSEKV